ncbi:Class I SAM-dependent methyltransferase (plasmid) [Rhodovastum atsumiense]|uniref:Class I SAM-dependent methyltransferase n=1 Tax=Rhodovastum atsumiense TaxID=504468 RepID=A0A5M6IJJ1_9PROT|nr:class I SAM-dependent methyltransferase [Rhodovastum atsumiense]KAA5608434.1 class I SAM-dependent methyltransferase [Rhodovastum atsumiense]CAH2605720.1 Class I SAM-dependent methyltransferase [Rhodovastum atsumiense]
MPIFRRFIRPTYLYLCYLASRVEDSRLGITTTDESVARALGRTTSDFRLINRATGYLSMRRILRRLKAGSEDVLLDYGCGAGRVICVAARHGVRRAIGVDIDPAFCAIAERNVASLKGVAVRPEVIEADAGQLAVPDETTIVFMYNPFGSNTLRQALTNIQESVARRPRRVRLAYGNPVHADLVGSFSGFREIDRLWMSWRPGEAWLRTQTFIIYAVDPP